MSTRIEFENLGNTRDLGGMKTSDGRHIAPGRLIRSGHLIKSADRDLKKLAGMINTIVDFRTADECAESPDPELPGVRYVRLPIMDSLTAGITREKNADAYALENLVKSPESSLIYMSDIYEVFASSAAANSGYASFINILLTNETGAVLWHCTAGKDRAGMGSAIIEKLLGVSNEDVYEDYMQTNLFITKELDELGRIFAPETGSDKLAMEYLFTAREEYIDRFFSVVDRLYGSFDGYAEKVLGVDAAKRKRLCDLYLV